MGYFDGYLSLYVSNGDTSDETDINNFALSVFNSFNSAEVDIVALQSNQSQSRLWSFSDQGILVTENTGGGTVQDYSSRAYMLESKEWAQSEDGTINLADGTTTSAKSAKEHATDAGNSATAASTSETNAAASESAAAASAAIAAGQNTISAGSGIAVNTTGVGPFDFEIEHGDTSSLSSTTNTLKTGIKNVTVDVSGHLTAVDSEDFELSPTNGIERVDGVHGFNSSNTGAANSVATTPGYCWDETSTYVMKLSSTLNKTMSSVFSEGDTGGGLLGEGTLQSSSVYNIYAIRKDSDGSVDIGCVLATTNPDTALPIGFSNFRYIGSFNTDSSGDVVNFLQRDDNIVLKDAVEGSTGIPQNNAVQFNLNIMCPAGRTKRAQFSGKTTDGLSGDFIHMSWWDFTLSGSFNALVQKVIFIGASQTTWRGSSEYTKELDIVSNDLYLATQNGTNVTLLCKGYQIIR